MKLSFTKIESQSPPWNDCGTERCVLRKSTIFRGVKIYCRFQLFKHGHTEWQELSKDYSFDGNTWIDDITEVQRQTKKMGL